MAAAVQVRPKSNQSVAASKIARGTRHISGRSRPGKAPALGNPVRRAPAVAEIRKRIGFSQTEFARITSYSTRAVADWEAGKTLDDRARRKVTEVDRLTKALSELMPAGHVGKWLREENDAFGGRSPLTLIERGESDRLWQMIHQIDANIAT